MPEVAAVVEDLVDNVLDIVRGFALEMRSVETYPGVDLPPITGHQGGDVVRQNCGQGGLIGNGRNP